MTKCLEIQIFIHTDNSPNFCKTLDIKVSAAFGCKIHLIKLLKIIPIWYRSICFRQVKYIENYVTIRMSWLVHNFLSFLESFVNIMYAILAFRDGNSFFTPVNQSLEKNQVLIKLAPVIFIAWKHCHLFLDNNFSHIRISKIK